MRFVCRLPTGSGVVVWLLSAAAAAAEESLGLGSAWLMYAEEAAAAAEVRVLRSRG